MIAPRVLLFQALSRTVGPLIPSTLSPNYRDTPVSFESMILNAKDTHNKISFCRRFDLLVNIVPVLLVRMIPLESRDVFLGLVIRIRSLQIVMINRSFLDDDIEPSFPLGREFFG